MTLHRVARLAIWLVVAGTVPCTVASARPDEPASQPPGEAVKWNLDRLRKEPFKLIKATPDPSGRGVRFLIEFTRRPELTELFDWEHRGGPVVFRFVDADGVVIRTVKPQVDGELIAEKGARLRLILPMPDDQVMSFIHSILAD